MRQLQHSILPCFISFSACMVRMWVYLVQIALAAMSFHLFTFLSRFVTYASFLFSNQLTINQYYLHYEKKGQM
jgi:hypothetical protein